jgi:transcriptional regulator GlxA family with amidase domain
MLNVGFLLGSNFPLSALSLFVDVLTSASRDGSRASWAIMSATGNPIRSSCGVWVSPDSALMAPQQFDYLVVIAGAKQAVAMDGSLIRYLQRASQGGAKIIGIGGGTFVLAGAGLLDGVTCCVGWFDYEAFSTGFPGHRIDSHHLWIEAGGLITCAGGTAVADMAADIVGRHFGRNREKNALETQLMPRGRRWNDIQPRNPLAVRHNEPRINAALIYMENNIEEDVDVARIAASMSLSRRQMERLFRAELAMSPTQVLLKLRLERARGILLRTNKPLLEVAVDAGFCNPSHFSRRFRQAYGQTPSQLRKKFA